MLKKLIPAVALFALAGAAQAQTQSVIYDNLGIDNPDGNLYFEFNTGATAQDLNTDLVADDINPIDGTAGAGITQFSFLVYNASADDVDASMHVSFYDDFNPDLSAGPGNYIGGVNFDSSTFLGNNIYLETYTSPTGTSIFTVPSDQDFWAGVSFSAAPGTSADDLNNLGQIVAGPSTVGGSDDKFFISDNTGPNIVSNPSGDPGYYFGGDPTANFAWQFLAATPEPSEYAGFGLGVLGLGGLALRARKRRALA